MLFDFTYKLNENEKVIALARKHWFLIIPKLLGSLAIIALLIIFANIFFIFRESFVFSAILAAVYVFYFIYVWILWRVDYFIITSERIIRIEQKGFWDKSLNEVSFSDIQSITLKEKGIAAAIFKFGTLKINLKKRDTFIMPNIADPAKIYQALIKLKEINR